MSEDPAVEIADLVKRYPGRTAVDGLALTVRRGTVTAVLGPNGAGKTTTVEICEGYRRADSGSVRVLGLNPARDGDALRPRVGVMLQSGGVYAGARAEEMLRHVASLYANPLPVRMLVERLGLQGCGRTGYRRLSGGQKQRLALALAVVGRPELVFLDEPTAGLDPQARHATWQLVRDLRSDGVTVVLTTHFMDEAEKLADEVAVVDAGRVIACGTPRALCRDTEGDALRFTAPPGLDVEALTAALPDGARAHEVGPGSYLVRGGTDLDVGPQLLAAVTAWCADAGVMPEGLGAGRRTLEDVFLELTGRELRS